MRLIAAIISFVVVVVCAGACDFGDQIGEPHPIVVPPTVIDLSQSPFPLVQGNRWTYELISWGIDGNILSDTIEVTVRADTAILFESIEVPVFPVESVYRAHKRTWLMANESEGLAFYYMHGCGGVRHGHRIVMLPFDGGPGDQWFIDNCDYYDRFTYATTDTLCPAPFGDRTCHAVVEDQLSIEYFLEGIGPVGGEGGDPKWPWTKRLIDWDVETVRLVDG